MGSRLITPTVKYDEEYFNTHYTHGSYAGYAFGGCRCKLCVDAWVRFRKFTPNKLDYDLLFAVPVTKEDTMGRCLISGNRGTDNHHLVRGTRKDPYAPTIYIEGPGNCFGPHGEAHQNRRFFAWIRDEDLCTPGVFGHLETILMDEPTTLLKALASPGWYPLTAEL